MKAERLPNLRTRWASLCEPLTPPESMLEDIASRYGEAHRRYHGLGHLDALADLFAEVREGPGWEAPAEVAAAMLFHDAVYRPGRRDNESQSAELAREALNSFGLLDSDAIDRVESMILATAMHGRHEASSFEHDRDHFLDCDMAVLGGSSEQFREYEEGVSSEYKSRTPALLYRSGRRRFLRSLLDGGPIFRTPYFHNAREEAARRNIGDALGH